MIAIDRTGIYCGPAPVPDEIWTRCNLDPMVLVGLAVLLLWTYRRGVQQLSLPERQYPADQNGLACCGACLPWHSSPPLYAMHAVAPLNWGFTPMADQQLGGLIMWVPSCLLVAA